MAKKSNNALRAANGNVVDNFDPKAILESIKNGTPSTTPVADYPTYSKEHRRNNRKNKK